MTKKRLKPDDLLQRVQAEERQEQRGKLKIYLGAAPGVGKTHEMLHDAFEERAKGLDVVIGVAESHGRKEIEAMLRNFEILPKQEIDYRDKKISEFDLDAALKRHPGLILMDEMAHTNAPGVRHEKRWQDIKELLDRGINVCTTLNVQHIESLNDSVSQIIHAPVNETVPDYMLDMADTIELVDIPPEELLKRLQEGKVYLPQQAELAKEHFFRKGNLIALRELALRTTAERVAEQVLLYRQGEGIRHIWPTKEKILVCVGSRSESLKLIRAAKRMAVSLQAEWIAVYVDTPRLQSSESERNNAIKNLYFAEQLGAETRILTGFDIVREIMNCAREKNITQIMVWKSIGPRWRDLLFRNLADEIVRHSEEIDVYIMTGERGEKSPSTPQASLQKSGWGAYIAAFSIVAIATVINFFLTDYLSQSNLIMVYLLGIVSIASYGQIGPSVVGSALSVLAYDFFFIPPRYSFAVSDVEYFFTLIVMLLVSYIISHLTVLIRRQSAAAELTERQTSALYSLSHRLANTRGLDKLLSVGTQYITEVFDCKVVALLPRNRQLHIWNHHEDGFELTKKELGVAQWVYELGQMAGLGTDNLPFSGALFLPMQASKSVIGVLCIRPHIAGRLFTPEQMRLLESCVHQMSSAIEIDLLQKNEIFLEQHHVTDFIRNTLFHTVSHDLRIPLVIITAEANMLMELGDTLPGAKIKEMGKKIYGETNQLNNLIGNLMQLSYLESNEIELHKTQYSLNEIINFIIGILQEKLNKNAILYTIPDKIPFLKLDKTLIQEVFINLVENAIKYSPAEKQNSIFVKVSIERNRLLVSVEDAGPGIMLDEKDKLFDKFYRGRFLNSKRGLGLGLAICKKIIEAHGGEIWAENRKEGGAAFRFTLPLSEDPMNA